MLRDVPAEELRGRALGEASKIAGIRDADLARTRLELLHRASGQITRKAVEDAIRSASNLEVRRFWEESVLPLFRPGEDAPLPPPIHASDRLSDFLALSEARQDAAYDALAGLTKLSSEDFNAVYGENGAGLLERLRADGLGSEDALAALADVVRAQRIRDEYAEEFALGRTRDSKNPSPLSLLENGIESARTRMKELLKQERAEKHKEYLNWLSTLPTPERMSTLFNRYSEVRQFEPGSPKWNEASAEFANSVVGVYRAYNDSHKGRPNFAKLESTAEAFNNAGYSLDFFESIRPGINLLETDYKFTAEDIRLAYDPEAIIREGLAQQAEGLDVCIR